MRRKSYKTVNLTKINIAHREACAKHPKFCDAMTNKSKDAVRKALAELRIENAEGPYFADRILHEEIAEALEAYLDGDLKHCMQELAQCGAVILRMMQYVEDECWAHGDTCKGGDNENRNPKRMEPSDIYALARARTQESIERVAKKRKRTKDTYKPQSYEEHKARCRENARKRAHDPKVIEAHRKTVHDWYEAHKRDPDFIERRKENQARYRAKVKADPVKNAARKKYMHDYCAKRYAKQKAELEAWDNG